MYPSLPTRLLVRPPAIPPATPPAAGLSSAPVALPFAPIGVPSEWAPAVNPNGRLAPSGLWPPEANLKLLVRTEGGWKPPGGEVGSRAPASCGGRPICGAPVVPVLKRRRLGVDQERKSVVARVCAVSKQRRSSALLGCPVREFPPMMLRRIVAGCGGLRTGGSGLEGAAPRAST